MFERSISIFIALMSAKNIIICSIVFPFYLDVFYLLASSQIPSQNQVFFCQSIDLISFASHWKQLFFWRHGEEIDWSLMKHRDYFNHVQALKEAESLVAVRIVNLPVDYWALGKHKQITLLVVKESITIYVVKTLNSFFISFTEHIDELIFHQNHASRA